jgi:hypothetical protein
MAERVGFEPTVRYSRTPDFESGTFDHSATSPKTGALVVNGVARNYSRFCNCASSLQKLGTTQVGAQRGRHTDAAICLLVVLQHRHHGAAYG